MTHTRLAGIGAALVACALPLSATAQQTLTFDNTTPPITVTLTNPSSVTFQDNGNVHASCQLGPDNRCLGMPPSVAAVPPTVSVLASDFSTPAEGGLYAPGTTFRIHPTVTNADICVRETSPTTPAGTGWGGSITSSLSSSSEILLPEGAQQYQFTLRCWGAGGTAVSAVVTVGTSVGGGGGGDQCPPGTQVGAPGFSQYLTYDEITDIPRVTGVSGNLLPFPNTGGQLGRLVIPRGRWVALRFTVPSSASAFTGLVRQFSWLESQVGGEASLLNTYVTVSQCAGDFRAPPAGNAPTADPTFSRGCRNLRPTGSVIGIRYADVASATASGDLMCNLTRGGTYYFNMILANPLDGGGIQPGETSCLNPDAPQCGIQFRAE